MNNEELTATVIGAAIEIDGIKKLPCAKAFQLSKEHGFPLKKIGECCEEKGIKISHCQLGCFQ